MPVLFGILASVGIGISDFLGRYCTRRTNATTTVLTALAAGLVTASLLTLVIPSMRLGRDLGLGAASGLTVGFALMLMYRGMAVSSTAVVSPVVALFVALIPLLWDVIGGASLSQAAAVGAVLAIGGIVTTTISPDLRGRVGLGLMLALGSGVLFGVGMTIAGETDIDSGVWPAVGQRAVAWITLLAYGTVKVLPPLLPRGLLRRGILSGVAGTMGMAMFIVGSQRGSLGPVAVASSMFPAVTAVLAFLFDDDNLRWWQWIGIAAALSGVGLIAAG